MTGSSVTFDAFPTKPVSAPVRDRERVDVCTRERERERESASYKYDLTLTNSHSKYFVFFVPASLEVFQLRNYLLRL